MKGYHILIYIMIFSLVACNGRRADEVNPREVRLEDHNRMQRENHRREGNGAVREDDLKMSERGGAVSIERLRTTEQRIRELKASHADMMQEHRKLMDEHRAFMQMDRSEMGEDEWHERFRGIEEQQAQMEREYQQMLEEYEGMRLENLRLDESRRIGN